ncbi:unnamed protein product [Victoria cruziana]
MGKVSCRNVSENSRLLSNTF